MRQMWRPLKVWMVLASVMCVLMGPVRAQTEVPLALDGQISEDGTKIGINWDVPNVGLVQAFRRSFGATGLKTWEEIFPRVLSTTRILDAGVTPGTAYEYQIRLQVKGAADHVGYWAAGQNVPARTEQGRALVVVADTVAEALGPHLDRFTLDLIGAGWEVTRHLTPPGARKDPNETYRRAAALRAWIADQYWADPFSTHVVILVGPVPIVRTGLVRPDGHDRQPVPSDLYYADPDGSWPVVPFAEDTFRLWPNALPADHIKMQVGRIDFSALNPAFGSEISLLRAYFDKNHHWRHGLLGDPRRAYGQSKHLVVEQNALRNIIGPDGVVAGGHHDTTGRGPFLFGVDFGHWKGFDYATRPPSEAVFAINFGSGKHFFHKANNQMRSLLAQPWFPLAVGWGGRPSWQLHGMAMGESIGQAHLRTVNNGTLSDGGMASRDYVPTGRYDWINPPWVNLMGDPTLRPFPLASVTDLRATKTPQGVRLQWRPPSGAAGVRVWRADQRDGPYRPLAEGEVLDEGSFVDPDPVPGAWYMVRARGLTQVHAGSFYQLSQGAFARVENTPPTATPARTSAVQNTPGPVAFGATDADQGDQLLISPILARGHALQQGAEGFMLQASRAGLLEVPYSVFDGTSAVTAIQRIEVEAALAPTPQPPDIQVPTTQEPGND